MPEDGKVVNRPPRLQPELPVGDVDLPNPPTPASTAGRLGLATTFIPLFTILGYALVASRGGSPLLMLPMAFVAIPSSAIGYMNWRRIQRVEREKKERYANVLENVRGQMQEAHNKQIVFYQHNYPSPDGLLELVQNNSTRLWERRPTDPDFGALRLGRGRLPSTVQLKQPASENIDAPQWIDAFNLATNFAFVQDAAISVSLHDRHAIGISHVERGQSANRVAPSRLLVTHFGRALLAHLTILHAPSDLRVFIAGSANTQADWAWAAKLPHCASTGSKQQTSDQLCFSESQASGFWNRIQLELERRQIRRETQTKQNPDNNGRAEPITPLLVVFVDVSDTAGGKSLIEETAAESAIALLLTFGHELGAAIIFMTSVARAIPSECSVVITLESNGADAFFRYAEIGQNTARYEGLADQLDVARAEQQFAAKIETRAMRTLVGSELPGSLTLLELGKNITRIEDLNIRENWRESRQPTTRWPEVDIGMMAGRRIRRLVFETNEGDGVHGLIAGTTGSGKSELLLSLVLGLAIRYDPSIVNFVLVDYKGGTTFQPLVKLPHTVDLITNLQGRAGARAFIAIRAELNRRSKLLADTRVTNIATYHEKNLHAKYPLPHLFIIIDEFAEMIKDRAEFKTQLESIATTGRALGVHLILATQRPSGVVSGQIDANMKFRICLRVESAEDSRELLGRIDAQLLPKNIAGRAYVRVGGDINLMQVARVGGVYQGPQIHAQPLIVWLNHQKTAGVESMTSLSSTVQETLADVLVRVMEQLADDDKEVNRQPKPWPDPLPERLLLSSLNSAVGRWVEGQRAWDGVDWTTNDALSTQVGVVDYPSQARQFPLIVDLSADHIVVFGTSGSGKTTFLRTLILGLVAKHAPNELSIYILDFGGLGLNVFADLPHLGDLMTSADTERVQRLFRRLADVSEERKTLLSQAQVSTLKEYNASHPDNIQPALLLVVDNFAELRDNFSDEVEALISLGRDGRRYGIHLVVCAEQISSLPSKVYGLFTGRLALKLAEATEYSAVVGRAMTDNVDIPGRGFVRSDTHPLEFQTALPMGRANGDEISMADELANLSELARQMGAAWEGAQTGIMNGRGLRPERIETLRSVIPLDTLFANGPTLSGTQTIIGLFDQNLRPFVFDLKARGPHFTVIGPPLSGKTTALRTQILAFASLYDAQQIKLVLVDFQRRLFNYGGRYRLDHLPHVVPRPGKPDEAGGISEVAELEQLMIALQTEFAERRAASKHGVPVVVLIDNYDDVSAVLSANRPLATRMGEMARQYGTEGLHFVVAGSTTMLRGDDFIRQVSAPRYGLGLDASDSVIALGGRMRMSGTVPELPPGRGYLVKSGKVDLIQMATPQLPTNTMEDSLDHWVSQLTDYVDVPAESHANS